MEPGDPNKSHHALRRALGFVLFLYVAWIAAWILELALEHRTVWMTTGGARFAYWTVMKLLLWVAPAVALLHASGRGLRDVLGLRRLRTIVVWGGGVGLIFAASALITRGVGHRPLFAPQFGWPFLGGVIIAPVIEEIAFRGAVLQTLLMRFRFLAANTLTAVFFLGIHLPGWYFQHHPSDMLMQPIGGALSVLIIGWALGLVAYKSKSVAASILTHILNNLFSAS
jgi:membrane protease YdiL (CAAX protease family)